MGVEWERELVFIAKYREFHYMPQRNETYEARSKPL
jgi:hypothetical protein